MKKSLLVIFLLVTASIAINAVESQPTMEFATNEMIVGFEYIDSRVLFDIEKSGGVVLEQIPALSAVRVHVAYGMENVFIAAIRAKPGVRYVERNAIFEVAYTPNDPYWNDLWGMTIIQADDAWDINKGSTSVTVAVIDTGIEYTHEDLYAHYVALGYDWVNDDNDPMDDHGHGTHCAGTVAAVMDNGKGVVGVAQVSIMAEKVIAADGYGTEDDVASGIVHAADAGAEVISMSIGSYSPSTLIEDACQYAWNKGCILLGAAGNDNTNLPHYPSAYDSVISVAATNRRDKKASYSNWGDTIELSAPGGDVGKPERTYILSTYIGNWYAWAYGTSMATPHVSGLAALAWSYEPNLTNQELRLHLRNTANDLGDPGWDQYFGYGRINAYRALDELRPPEKMHVGDISMWYDTQGPWYNVYTKVPILDEYNQSVSGVTVYLDTELPDSSIESFIGTTDDDGTVTFNVRSRQTGTYTSTVTNVVKEGWIYDPGSNVETS